MKWLRTITGVVENVVSMFRQVDTLIQRIHNRQYIAKVKYENGVYKITVVDREGNAVDGAIILVYLYDPTVISTYFVTTGSLHFVSTEFYGILRDSGTSTKSYILSIPSAGIRIQILNNPRATLKVCVLGIEQGI